MAVVVDTKLQRKLAKEKSRWAKSKHKQDLSCCREDGGGGEDKANSRSRLALHILKNSRLF